MIQDLAAFVDNRRILIVLSGTFQPSGGMFEYAKAWLDLLLRRGWDVGICGVANVINAINLPVTKFEMLKLFDANPKLYKLISLTSLLDVGPARRLKDDLEKQIIDFAPSVVHIVDRPPYTAYLLGRLATKYPKTMLVATIHDPKRHEEKVSRIARFMIGVDDRRLLLATHKPNVLLHVHDKKLTNGTLFGNAKQLIEMPHPFPNLIAERRRRELNIDELYPIRIGFLGRIEQYKGLDILFEAISSAIHSGYINSKHVEIIIAGRGDVNQDWDSLPCHVSVINTFVSDVDFHQIMADLDVLVLPYKTATQSGVGMMGVAYGIPIIATNVGALDLLIEDGVTGFLINPDSVEELSKILSKLMCSPNILVFLRKNAILRCPTP